MTMAVYDAKNNEIFVGAECLVGSEKGIVVKITDGDADWNDRYVVWSPKIFVDFGGDVDVFNTTWDETRIWCDDVIVLTSQSAKADQR